jgi:cell division protein FtsW (lipid II flippase)
MIGKRWTIFLAAILLSIILYLLHFALFQDAHHIWIYLVGDLDFLPVEVLLVTLILHQLLEARDRKFRLEKMNLLIGTFFSNLGTQLLPCLSDNDPNMPEFERNLVISDSWSSTMLKNDTGDITARNITL